MLQLVKDTLRITWDSDDDFINQIIERGQAHLDELVGTGLDYTKTGLAQNLFLNYCRYDYNNALEYFETNFQKEILRLQLTEGIRLLPKEGDPP